MNEPVKPTVVELKSRSTSRSKTSYIKDSSNKIRSIARVHGLDASFNDESTKMTLLERALKRERQQKEQKQKNLEHIIKFALGSCKDEMAGDPDQDWLCRFFEMAQDIHNSSMQKLWAQVLKREVTNPGSTSMKALQILKDMTPKEAQILQKAAALSCAYGQDHSRKLLMGLRAHHGIFSLNKREQTLSLNLGNFQLPYSNLLILIELGLLHGRELESGEIDFDPALIVSYQGKNISIQPTIKGVRLLYYRFSPTGNELCKLLGNKVNQDYYDQMISLLSHKFVIHSELNSTIDHMI